ncbi:MAG: hypothetical protein DCC55_33685, partial [Chloroflexi bacterium]
MKIVQLLLAIVLTITTMIPLGPTVQTARAEEVAPAAVSGPAGADAAYLAEELAKYGSVPLIIGLDMPGYDPALFDMVHAAGVQEAAIASAQQALLGRLATYDVSNVKMFEYIPYMALTVNSPEGLAALYNDPDVISIQEDRLLDPALIQSVPLIKADQVHTTFAKGSGYAVAVLDTGVEKTHPALAGKVVSEACYSTTDVTRNSSSMCPGGVASSIAPDSALPCAQNILGCDHGTHVSGIVAGVAPGARIIAIQVFSRYTDTAERMPCGEFGYTSPCTRSSASDIIAGLNRVYALRDTYKIAAANLSLGSGQYTTTCDNIGGMKPIVDLLRSAGIATVVSSGNAGHRDAMGWPACLSTVISVGATDKYDAVAGYSNLSSFTTLMAPGSNIRSALPLYNAFIYGQNSGTSMAAPHVAGALAVLKEVRPTVTVNEIISALASTGPLIRDQRVNGTISKRRLDLYEAACRLANCEGDDFRTIALGQTLNGTINPATDRDYYFFNGTAGERLVVHMRRTVGNVDPYIQLYEPSGVMVSANDNGSNPDALINGFPMRRTGRWMIVASGARNTSGSYSLTVSSDPIQLDNPVPRIVGISPPTATSSLFASDFWLALSGSGFMRESQTYWNNQARGMFYASNELIYIRVLGSDLRTLATSATVTVRNPTPGGGFASIAFPIRFGLLGESELVSPESGSVVPAGIKQSFVISWTHPTDSWRTMQNMDLRLRSPEGSTLASIRVVEREGTNSVYRLLNGAGEQLTEEDGETPAEGLGGDDRDLELPGLLTLHLAESAFSGSGQTAIMTPTVTFGPEAVGVYNIEFRVDGPEGEVQDDDVLGQFTITSAECPYPVTSLTLSGAETGVAGADYAYTATLEPFNASQPLTLTWSPEPASGQGASTAVYNWGSAGEHFVFVSAENCGGFAADVQAVRIRTSETPDLSIRKSGPAVAVAGEVITYTLTISNSGAETATNLVVLDELPAGATHVSGGTLVGNSVRWDLPELAGYGAVTETTVSVIANTTLSNTAYSVSAQGGYAASGGQPVVTRLVAAKTSSDPLSDASLYTSDDSGRRLIDIILPAGSIFEETTFTLDELAEPGYALPEGLSYAGRAFRLGAYQQNRSASDLELGEAISLTVAYDAADAASVHSGTLGLYHWDGSQWTQEGLECTVQSEQQHLACRYSGQRLTQFALATSTATETVAAVALSASSPTATAEVGTAVEYRLTVTNTGNAIDSFTVTVDSSWSASISTGSVGPLASGASAEFSVTVTVPAEAVDGESNVATVGAASQADGSVQAQVSLTTTAHRPPGDDDPADQPNRLFLPAILSQGSGAGLSAQITSIGVEDGRYVIRFTTAGYTPALPGQHVHFF